jgi:cytochrome c biogenesis protein CcmG/thiol:disulfide interchange protein DsbE
VRRLLYLLPLLGFAALAGYFYLSLGGDPAVLPSAMIDQPAPEFRLDALAGGKPLARSDFTGEVVLINFFASWCAPCREEHALLMHLSDELKVPLYGIDYKDKPEAGGAFLHEFGDPYEAVGTDRDGRVGIDFGVYGVPETYVIDKVGRIRFRHAGPLTPDDVAREIAPLVRALQRS